MFGTSVQKSDPQLKFQLEKCGPDLVSFSVIHLLQNDFMRFALRKDANFEDIVV